MAGRCHGSCARLGLGPCLNALLYALQQEAAKSGFLLELVVQVVLVSCWSAAAWLLRKALAGLRA